MYIVDGFSHQWVLTPGSIDLMIGAYIELAGYYPSSKDQVMSNLQWGFTGRRSTQYQFQGAGLVSEYRVADGVGCSSSLGC